jgi:hypothetical protein
VENGAQERSKRRWKSWMGETRKGIFQKALQGQSMEISATWNVYLAWRGRMGHDEDMENDISKSEFTGGLLGLIGINILILALFVFTLGLGLPWCVCLKQDWLAKHTIIDGRRVWFDGNGLQLFGNYIKWFLLCIVTLGIYGFWMSIKFRQWTTRHMHFAG